MITELRQVVGHTHGALVFTDPDVDFVGAAAREIRVADARTKAALFTGEFDVLDTTRISYQRLDAHVANVGTRLLYVVCTMADGKFYRAGPVRWTVEALPPAV